MRIFKNRYRAYKAELKGGNFALRTFLITYRNTQENRLWNCLLDDFIRRSLMDYNQGWKTWQKKCTHRRYTIIRTATVGNLSQTKMLGKKQRETTGKVDSRTAEYHNTLWQLEAHWNITMQTNWGAEKVLYTIEGQKWNKQTEKERNVVSYQMRYCFKLVIKFIFKLWVE